MLQKVNTVLIAKTAPASFSNVDSLADGAIALFDENKKLLTTAANAAAANADDKYLNLFAKGVERILIEMNVPGKDFIQPCLA